MANIKIGTFNVKGLREVKKRRKVFQYIHQRQYDIICVQETHSKKEDESLWSNEFGGKIIFSHGSNDSRGTMILTRKKSPIVLGRSKIDKEGRVVFCEIKHEETTLILVNIYAPNQDNPSFFLETFSVLLELEKLWNTSDKIVVGDFNLVMDLEKDKQGGKKMTHTKSAEIVRAFNQIEGLEDVWRLKHPDDNTMTWRVLKPKPIFERLDYIFVSNNLLSLVGNEGISPAFMSDHSIPWIVLTPTETVKGRGFWQLNVRLLSDKEYCTITKDLIKSVIEERGKSISTWEWLKHKVRENTISYSSAKNKSRQNTLLIYEKKLKDYQQMLQEMKNEDTKESEHYMVMSEKEILDQIKRIENSREEIIEYKVRGSMVRARRDWTLHGEKPSRYYLSLEGHNYKRKNRYNIRDPNGILICGIRNVLKEQKNFYQALYDTKHQFSEDKFKEFIKVIRSPKIKPNDVEMLDNDITLKELRTAVFGSKRGKVSGSDGLNIEFFQNFFDDLKHLMLYVCHSASKNGLHTTARQGIISLIEKSERDLTYLTNWRPLSLLNVDGKVYSKILTNRIDVVTSYIIHKDQSGFQKNRSIQDNLMDLMSILDYAEHKNLPLLLLSFDFEKAFDKINWEYLDASLEFFGFGKRFRQMVKNVHIGTTSCTVNCGISSEYININNGLRQGSPLSPALFNIAVEILGLVIRQNDNIIGINVNGRQKKHGQYADDMWAVIEGTQKTYDVLLDIFENFAKISGLKINLDKTQVLRIGSLRDTNIKLKSKKPMQWKESIKILGITISAHRQHMLDKNYDDLVKKLKRTLDPWKSRTMSLAGKITVVNSLLISQTIYKIMILNTPNDNIKRKIKDIITNFIWNGKKAKIAYDTLIKEYQAGGLKLVDFNSKDVAMKISWVKKSFTTTNVWKDIMQELLSIPIPELFKCNLKNKDITQCFRISENWTMMSILREWSKLNYKIPKVRTEVMNQVLWFNSEIKRNKKPYCIDNMMKKGIWTIHDIWDTDKNSFKNFEELEEKFGDMGNFLDYHALIENIPTSWKKMLIRVDVRTEESQNIIDLVERNDKVTRGVYWFAISTKTNTYDHGKMTWEIELKVKWTQEQWESIRLHAFKIALSVKHRLFQYKLLSKKLATNVLRNKWDANISPLCVFCNVKKETTPHLMWECEKISDFWKNLKKWVEYTCKIKMELNALVIVTNKNNGREKLFLDTIIIVAKQYIYATKCLNEKLKINVFLSKLYSLYVTEKEIALQTGIKGTYKRKWSTYEKNIA